MKRKYFYLIGIICVLCMLSGCGKSQEPSRSAGAELQEFPASAQIVSTTDTSALDTIVDISTTQYFSNEAVRSEDIETIVMAGVNAPSAMNGQPWHFSVITDSAVLEQISEGMSFGGGMPGAGVPSDSMPEGFEMPEGFAPPAGFGAAPDAGSGLSKAGLGDSPLVIVVSCKNGSELDAGLACQNMSAAAQLLGYGSKIISSPTMALNGEKQDEYRELLGIPEDMSAVALLLVGYEDSTIDESIDGYTAASERKPVTDVVTYVKG